jgi:proteasome lid subunit RPN8/RPN11
MALRVSRALYQRIVDHANAELPNEACGLLAGVLGSDIVDELYPCRNAAEPEKRPVIYELHPLDHLQADRDATSKGMEILGVYHSHTHTDAYPSPTDLAQAPDPAWHYVLVSLRHPTPVVRSYRIVDGVISEEPLVLERPVAR